MKYDHKTLEQKWQKKWQENWAELYGAKDFSDKQKYFVLIEFPYPSGEGLHMGHPRPYIAFDVVARKRRMEGYNVLYPIGWDAFGLPAENYAIKTGAHPSVTTQNNIKNFRRQIKSLGISFDWSREVDTTDPKYYKWTQWMFLQFFKKGLAYKATIPINWCSKDKIGLANEEVVGGKCERCGSEVEKRDKEQWMIAITKYADRLIDDLKTVDYLPKIKKQQEDWIGRSEGVEINFKGLASEPLNEKNGSFSISEKEYDIPVFTTRPDTLFGVTYIVLAPEHPVVSKITSEKEKKGVEKYIAGVKNKSETERAEGTGEKTGVPLGVSIIHPFTGEKIPVWIADYVLMNYGTGAVMGVPAHDERDFDFAKKYGLKIKWVIAPTHEVSEGQHKNDAAYTDAGFLVNSNEFSGLTSNDAKQKITDALESGKAGRRQTNYHLRDWVFSRQRYWGEPIPIVHCPSCGIVPVPESELPVCLPEVEKYQPTDNGESPLAAISEWVNTVCPNCGGKARRETDVMPNWAGSSWYFLRYCDPNNDHEFASAEKLRYWMPVNWYNGGMEHTTLHLLYSRFWNKFLFDIVQAPTSEPYDKRTSHGLILASDGEKMSKSRGNVINPDSVVEEYGADALRCYEMFIGPFDQAVSWDTKSVIGVRRFLEKVSGLFEKVATSVIASGSDLPAGRQEQSPELERVVHKTVKKITEDIEAMKFNTAVSQLMICVNTLNEAEKISVDLFEIFLKVFSVFAPHMSEELWEKLGHAESITKEKWPVFDSELACDSEIELVVQVNGKLRDRINLPADLSEDELKVHALSSEKIKQLVEGKKVRQVIIARRKLVNIVLE